MKSFLPSRIDKIKEKLIVDVVDGVCECLDRIDRLDISEKEKNLHSIIKDKRKGKLEFFVGKEIILGQYFDFSDPE